MKWLDTHNHVCSVNTDGAARPGFASGVREVLAADPAELKLVLSPDSIWFSRIQESPEGLRAAAEEIRDVVRIVPERLLGAFMPNPHFADASLRLMDTCFGEWGFVMLGEMMQYSMDFRLASPDCLRLLRHAAALDVPVMAHVATFDVKQGMMTGSGQLLDLLDAAEQVPEGKFILGHLVGMPRANPTWVEHYIDIVEHRFGSWPRNLWAEIRDFGSPGLADALARIPLDRLVSGTDWTTRGGPPFAAFGTLFDCAMNGVPHPYDTPASSALLAGFLEHEGLTPAQIHAIAYGNAAALLGLDDDEEVGELHPNAAESARPGNGMDLDWLPDDCRFLYVLKVPLGMGNAELLERFRAQGLPAVAAHTGYDCHTGRSWGHAFVEMRDAGAAQHVLALPADEKAKIGPLPVYLARFGYRAE